MPVNIKVLDFTAKEGERFVIQATLKGADGNVADLTGRTVVFNMRPLGSTTTIVNAGACTIVGSPTAGTVLYSGHVTDTTTHTGDVEADFLSYVTGQTPTTDAGDPQKFPNGKGANLYGYIEPKVA